MVHSSGSSSVGVFCHNIYMFTCNAHKIDMSVVLYFSGAVASVAVFFAAAADNGIVVAVAVASSILSNNTFLY